MKLKMRLTYLLLFLGLVMFSNQAVYAQKVSVSIFQANATCNFSDRSAQNFNQDDLCYGLTANQINYQSRLEPRDEKSEFMTMNRKYYLTDAEINKPSPVMLNSSFNYYAFLKDSAYRLETKAFYLNKSKNQRTTGWILLGAGTATALVGLIGAATSTNEMFGELLVAWDTEAAAKASSKGDTYAFIMLIGIAADLVSIPFFISASHNKKKASTLSFSNQTIYFPLDKSYCRNLYPSLTLRIKL
jgi:hypothetical protein